MKMKKMIRLSGMIILLVCLCSITIPLYGELEVGSPEDTYEQETDRVADRVIDRVADQPNPTENIAAVKRSVASTVSAMGFQVVSVKEEGNNRFVVTVKGWDSAKTTPRYKGAISRMSSKKQKNQGTGELVVISGKNGLYITKESLKKLGMQVNKGTLKGKL
jgi:hypothetical protein